MPVPQGTPNPYAEFQQPAAATANPYAEFQQPAQQAAAAAAPPQSAPPPVSLWQTMKNNFNAGTQHPAPPASLLGSFSPTHMLQEFGAGAGDAIRAVPHMFDPQPTETLQQRADRTAAQGGQEVHQFISDPGGTVASHLGAQAPGFIAGAGLEAAPQAASGAAKLITAPLRSGIDEPITGTTITPRQRYQSAKNVGVQLDAADATNSTPLKMAKSVNQHSLLGSGIYDARKAENLDALQGSTDQLLTSMYDGDRQSGGAAIQTALKRDQQGLQTDATAGFSSLPPDFPISGSLEVGKTAEQIAKDQAAYQEQFPSLAPKQANAVVSDVAKLAPKAPQPGAEGPVWEKPSNFRTMQQLRSDLLDMGRNDPDLVKNQSGGWYQRLSGTADGAITDAATGLPPELQNTFRDANAKWSDMKGTYDDPSNPLYHALRTKDPSTLYSGDGLGSRTPEGVTRLLPRLGNDSAAEQNYQPNFQRVTLPDGSSSTIDVAGGLPTAPAVGALRRGVVEGALKTTNDGSPNFKTFGTQLNRIPADYRAELFTLPQNETLRDLSNTSNLLSQDINPSGTAKLNQKNNETGAFWTGLGSGIVGGFTGHPVAGLAAAALGIGEPLAQYPLSRLINSPRFTDYLMDGSAPRLPATSPVLRLLPMALQQQKPYVPQF